MKPESFNLMIGSINFKTIVAFLAMSGVAVVAGLVAATGSPILVVMVIGMLSGVALLMAPQLSIWMLLLLGMFSGFVVSLGPEFSKMPWALTLLSILLLLPVMIKFIENNKIPAFIWIALIFMIYAVLASFVQWQSLSQFIAGFKRYFQMYGLMFALALLTFKPEDYKRWFKLMLIIALAQLPFALYERFVLVSWRSGSGSIVGAEDTDVVAGTLGANLEGGSSNAEMAAFLIMTMAFLIGRWKGGMVEKSRTAWLCLLCLLPLGLGETKIVILLLPLVWLIMMREDFKNKSSRFLLQFLGLLIVTSSFGLIYIGLNKSTATDVLTQSLSYNVGTQGYGNVILNRTTAISFWWANHNWNDTLELLLGHGLGSSYFNPSNPVAGHIGVQYIGYGIDLTTVSSLLWDTGVLGLLLFFTVFIIAWMSAGRLRKISCSPEVIADALAIQACIAVLLIFTYYDMALVNVLPFELIAAAILGYLGYLVRQQNSSSPPEMPTSTRDKKY